MRNKLIVTVLIISILAITGCSPKVTYLEEFSYLPAVEGMEVDDFEEAKGDGFGNAIYKIADEDYEDFLDKYEEILVKDGWEITEENKPENLEATKDNHTARINVVDINEELQVSVTAEAASTEEDVVLSSITDSINENAFEEYVVAIQFTDLTGELEGAEGLVLTINGKEYTAKKLAQGFLFNVHTSDVEDIEEVKAGVVTATK